MKQLWLIAGVLLMSRVAGAQCISGQLDARKKIIRAVEQRYQAPGPGYRVVVAGPACVKLPPEGALLDHGSGHGDHLTILAIDNDGKAQRLTIQGRHSPHAGPDAVETHYETAQVAAPASVLFASAFAAALTIGEQKPHEREGSLQLSGWGSSGDFYVRVDEHEYAGYPGSDIQLTYIGWLEAARVLETAFELAPHVESTNSAAARALFERAFLRASPTFDEEFHWWVRELYVRGAVELGSAAMIPLLTKYSLARANDKDASIERTRAAAQHALLTIH